MKLTRSQKHLSVLAKICGITNAEDARWAVNLGADFVGLNFYSESPRKVSIEKATEIVESVPSFVKVVGVFVNPELPLLDKVLKKVNLSILQLHGDEPLELIRQIKSNFKRSIWKAIQIENEDSIAGIPDFTEAVDTVLLDGFKDGQWGGTGKSFDWSLAVKAKEYGIPVFLAGGLTPENVAEAVKEAEPYGVDVASGVETENHPRKKNIDRMKQFLETVKGGLF